MMFYPTERENMSKVSFYSCTVFVCLCVIVLAAPAHASHQWVSNEEEPEAHRLERHDTGTAPGYSQWPALPDWKWVDCTHSYSIVSAHSESLTSSFNYRNEQEKWGNT